MSLAPIRKHGTFIILMLLVTWLLSGCEFPSGDATETPIPTESVIDETEAAFRVEGRLVPKNYLDLSLPVSGQVAEIFVNEGDAVAAGEVLLRLKGDQAIEARVAAAELERLRAQQDLDDLYLNADSQLAQARLALAHAERELAFAEDKVESLQRPKPQSSIDQTYANLLLAEQRLDQIRDDIQRFEKKYNNKDGFIWLFLDERDFRLLFNDFDKLEAYAERRYIDALEKYDDMLAPPDQIDLAMAVVDETVAQAKVLDAQRDVATLENGPDPDLILAAEARLEAAETALEAAKAALADQELIAPISGKIIAVQLKESEWLEANQPVIIIADDQEWVVETDDLTELEVPEVAVGQAVTILPDALPDLELAGVVESIKYLSEEKQGDVTYTARIRLEQSEPRLRWGMTVGVDF